MIGIVPGTMQQNEHRSFLPAPATAVEPAINDVVVRNVSGPGRGKAEMQRTIKFNLRRSALGRNEVRTVQELQRLIKMQGWSLGQRPAPQKELKLKRNGHALHNRLSWFSVNWKNSLDE